MACAVVTAPRGQLATFYAPDGRPIVRVHGIEQQSGRPMRV
jgi:hypothetical protein